MSTSAKTDPKLLALATRKEAQLIGLLSALSEELAAQLAEALERDRLGGGSGLPFDAIMTGLRPKLRGRGPAARRRTPTPQRAFFEVIEGLIVDDRVEEKRPGRIARRSLDPIWRWLQASAGDKLSPLIAEITKSLLKADRAEIRAALAPLDSVAGDAIRSAVKKADGTPKYAKELTGALGGQRGFEDMKELGRILQIAEQIRALRDALPAVIDEGVAEQFAQIRGAYDTVVEKFPAGAPYVVLSLAPRVTHPWELFGIAAKLVQAEDDQDLKQSELSMVGEWLVLDLETEAAALKNLKVAGFDPQRADEILRRFAVLQAGMTREVGMRKEGLWGKRLLKARGAVSEGLEALFAGIVQELRAGLPMQKATSGAKSGALVPRIDDVPDQKLVARLDAILQFLGTAKLFANQLGYSVAFEKTKGEVTGIIDDFAGGVIGMLHSAKKNREIVQSWAEACQKIMAPIFTEEALKIFNRRLAAAINEQQQAKA